MSSQISREELDAVKRSVADAEAGKASLTDLARAHEICARAGAAKTLSIVDEHIRRLVPNRVNLMPNLVAGLLSGTIVALTIGRLLPNGNGGAG